MSGGNWSTRSGILISSASSMLTVSLTVTPLSNSIGMTAAEAAVVANVAVAAVAAINIFLTNLDTLIPLQ